MRKRNIKKIIAKILLISLLLFNNGMSVLASSIEDVVELQEEMKENKRVTPSKIYRNTTFSEIEEEIEENESDEIYEEDINGDFEEEPEEDVVVNENEEKIEKEENKEINIEGEQNEDLFNVEINDEKEDIQENINEENIEEIKEDKIGKKNNIETPSETNEILFEYQIEKEQVKIETPSEIEKVLYEIENVDTPSFILKESLFGAGGPVCKIGTTEYLTLGEAITALKNGSAIGDIVFINDLEVTDISECQEIDINIDVNIDFNNKKLKITSIMPRISDGKGVITKKGTGKLYIKNMIVETHFNSSQGSGYGNETTIIYMGGGEAKFENIKYETVDITSCPNVPYHYFIVIRNNTKVFLTGDSTSFNLIKDDPSTGLFCEFSITKLGEGQLEIEKGTYKAYQITCAEDAGSRSASSGASKIYIKNGNFETKDDILYVNYTANIQIDTGTFNCKRYIINSYYPTPTTTAIIKNGNYITENAIFDTFAPMGTQPLCLNIKEGKYQYLNLLGMYSSTAPENIKLSGGQYKSTKVDGITFTLNDAKEELRQSIASGYTVANATAPYQWKVTTPYVPPIDPPYIPSGGNGGGGGGGSTIPIYDENGNIIKPGTIYDQPIIPENNILNNDSKTYDWKKDSNGYWELTILTKDNNKRKCMGELVEIEEIVNNQKVVNKYLFTLEGKMFTGWFVGENNITYYFNQDNNKDIGKMVTGWKLIKNNYYYFNNDGILLVNTITPDGYIVDSSGKWIRN